MDGEDNRLPPRTLMLDVTMTHDRYGRTTQHSNGAFTHRISSNCAPHPDGALKNAARKETLHYRQLYSHLPVAVNTWGRLYDDFIIDFLLLIFLHAHREVSVLTEQSDQFRFLRTVSLTNLNGSVVLMYS